MHVTTPIIKQIDTGIQPRWVAFEISKMSNGQIGYSRHWLGAEVSHVLQTRQAIKRNFSPIRKYLL